MIVLSDKKVLTGILTSSGNWTKAFPSIDLKTTPLEIKTNSTREDYHKVDLYFYTKEGYNAGGLQIFFNARPGFFLNFCSVNLPPFPTSLPTTTDKIWKISLTRTSGIRFQMHCNKVEVANVLLSDATCDWSSNWRHIWGRDVQKIKFAKGDTASDYYRILPGAFNVKESIFSTKIFVAIEASHCERLYH